MFCGIEFDGFLDLLDRSVQILQAGQRVGEQDLCVDVLPVERECVVCTRLGVLELLRQEQELSSLDLRLDVLREQICGSHVLARRPPRVSALNVGLRQLVAGLTKARILRERIPVLNDGLSSLVLAEQLISARQVFSLGDFRIA